jgi:WD40 repeat protein
MTPDARLALSGGDDSTLRLWDLDAGRELHRVAITTDWVRCVALTSDGRRAVSGTGPLVYVWDLTTWAPSK